MANAFGFEGKRHRIHGRTLPLIVKVVLGHNSTIGSWILMEKGPIEENIRPDDLQENVFDEDLVEDIVASFITPEILSLKDSCWHGINHV